MNIEQINLQVDKNQAGLSLKNYLRKQKINLPYVLIQKLLRKKAVRVNGERVKENYILNINDEVTIPAKENKFDASKIKKEIIKPTLEQANELFLNNIIFENSMVYCINKPKGLAVQGGTGITLSLDNILNFLYDEKLIKNKAHLVHRLDKDTTGILLIAKDYETAQRLGQDFKYKNIEKKYITLVAGKVERRRGEIKSKLGNRRGAGGAEKIVVDNENGKLAITYYEVLGYYGNEATLLEVEIKTGRKHQIRAHMESIGHPIVGDGKYGGKDSFIDGLDNQIYLHSWKVTHGDNYFPTQICAPDDRFRDLGIRF